MAKKIKPLYKGRRLEVSKDIKSTIDAPKVVCDQKKIIKEQYTYIPDSKIILVNGLFAIADVLGDSYTGNTRVWYQNNTAKALSTIPYDYFVTESTNAAKIEINKRYKNYLHYPFNIILDSITKSISDINITIHHPYKNLDDIVNYNINGEYTPSVSYTATKVIHNYSTEEMDEDNGNINTGLYRTYYPILASRSKRLVLLDLDKRVRDKTININNNLDVDKNNKAYISTNIFESSYASIQFYKYSYVITIKDNIDEDDLIVNLFSSNSGINVDTKYQQLSEKQRQLFSLNQYIDYQSEEYRLRPVIDDTDIIFYLDQLVEEQKQDIRNVLAPKKGLTYIFDQFHANSYFSNIGAMLDPTHKKNIFATLNNYNLVTKSGDGVVYKYDINRLGNTFTMSDLIYSYPIANYLLVNGQYHKYGTVTERYVDEGSTISQDKLSSDKYIKQDSITNPISRDNVSDEVQLYLDRLNVFERMITASKIVFSSEVIDTTNNDNGNKFFYNSLMLAPEEHAEYTRQNYKIGKVKFNDYGKSIYTYLSHDHLSTLDPFNDRFNVHFHLDNNGGNEKLLTKEDLYNWEGDKIYINYLYSDGVNRVRYFNHEDLSGILLRYKKDNMLKYITNNKEYKKIAYDAANKTLTLPYKLSITTTEKYFTNVVEYDNYKIYNVNNYIPPINDGRLKTYKENNEVINDEYRLSLSNLITYYEGDDDYNTAPTKPLNYYNITLHCIFASNHQRRQRDDHFVGKGVVHYVYTHKINIDMVRLHSSTYTTPTSGLIYRSVFEELVKTVYKKDSHHEIIEIEQYNGMDGIDYAAIRLQSYVIRNNQVYTEYELDGTPIEPGDIFVCVDVNDSEAFIINETLNRLDI